MGPDLVTVGGLTIDNVIAADGTVALARVGGNAAYSGVGARCFVGGVGLVSMAVASFPQETLDRLEANGLSLEGVVRRPERLRYADWFVYDEAGDRLEHLRSLPGDLAAAGFDATRLTREEVARWVALLRAGPGPDEPSYSQFRHAHPMSVAQVPARYRAARGVHLAPSRIDVVAAMAEHFAPTGMTVTLDPGWQLARTPLDELAPLLARVDAFLPSAVELASLLPDTGIDEALRVLSGLTRGTAAVKLGPSGARVWDRAHGVSVAVPALKVAAVDPTGAGDSWSGGFLAGLVETGDPVRAAAYGAVAAARIVTRFGADGALPVDEAACRADLARLSTALSSEERPR